MTAGDTSADPDLGARRPSALLKAARDPAAPPDRLRRILDIVRHAGSGPRRAVLEAVASNPNAPPDVLAELVRTCPDAVRANPALPLLALEAPDFAALMDEVRLRELLRDPSLPAALLSAVAADGSRPTLAAEARMHVALAGEAGPGWRDELRTWWRAHVRNCDGLAHVTYRELADLSLSPGWTAEEMHGESPLEMTQTPREVLTRLETRFGSMAHLYDPARAAEAAGVMLGGPVSKMHQLAVCLNPSLSADEIRRLWRRITDNVALMALAEHPNTAGDVLVELAGIDLTLVRWAVSRRADSPPEALDVARTGALRRPLRWRGGSVYGYVNPIPPLARYIALTRGQADPAWPAAVRRAADGDEWHERLAAAVALPEGDVAHLIAPLADDGNRYVRAAARARLAEPGAEVFAL